jgi:hypothetical protein
MDKFKFYLEYIQGKYLHKNKFNQKEVCELLEISVSKFNYIINRNDLHKLPKFSYEETIRKNGRVYKTYSFDIFDVAEFLSKPLNVK